MSNVLTQARLKELLHYCPESGEFRWQVSRGSRNAGEGTGANGVYGCLQIRIDKNTYLAHRLAWLYMTGSWPIAEIDHINNVRNDNRFSNLRQATRAENNANAKRRKDATYLKGVTAYRRKFAAQIQVNKRKMHLGCFETPEAAHAAYCAAADKHFKEYANHG